MVNWRVLLHLLCEFFMVRHLPIISVFQSMEFSEEVADEFMVRKDSLRCFRFLDYLKFKIKADIGYTHKMISRNRVINEKPETG